MGFRSRLGLGSGLRLESKAGARHSVATWDKVEGQSIGRDSEIGKGWQ